MGNKELCEWQLMTQILSICVCYPWQMAENVQGSLLIMAE